MMEQKCGVGLVLLLLVYLMHSAIGQSSVARLSTNADNILLQNLDLSTRISIRISNRNSASGNCTTPEGQPGSCGLVSECPVYLPLVKDIRDSGVGQFFIDRVCRVASQSIEVCCPLNTNRPSSTSTTTVTPTMTSPSVPLQFDETIPLQPGQGRPPQQPPRKPTLSSQRPNDRRPVNTDIPSKNSSASIQPTPDLPGPTASIPPIQPTHTDSFQSSPTVPVQASPTVSFPDPSPFIPDRIGSTVHDRDPQDPKTPDTAELPASLPFSVIPSEGECGLLIHNDRSVNVSRRQSSWPWLVSLGQLEESEFVVSCAGALITHRHILAAAHCLTDPRLPKPTHVQLGDPKLGQNSDTEASENLSILDFTDAGYNSTSFENDLAIVTLSKDITFTDFIQPVCLPFRFKYDGFRYQDLNVAGWETIISGSNQAQQTLLQNIQVSVIGLGDCRGTYQRALSSLVIDRRHLCGVGGSKDCVTDNGAPMFFLDEDTTNRYFLVGIVSYGFGCKQPNSPGVYTRIGAFLDWIRQNLK
ncbi:uncharacterized protein [Panulirus ornatus]|uniref:uncharacterized protein isoform X1 n=1 Tax=Panulirus ornatus TaxID=150431 RepID=UPI003A891BC8